MNKLLLVFVVAVSAIGVTHGLTCLSCHKGLSEEGFDDCAKATNVATDTCAEGIRRCVTLHSKDGDVLRACNEQFMDTEGAFCELWKSPDDVCKECTTDNCNTEVFHESKQ